MKKFFLLAGAIIGFLSGIITIIKEAMQTFENQEYSLLSIATNVWIWIAIVFIILAIILCILYKRIKVLENESSIPRLNGNFLGHIHLKQKRSRYIDNNMSIISLEKITEISGDDGRKDSKATLKIYGELLRDTDNFKFVIANDFDSSALRDNITIMAKDISNDTNLNIFTPDKDGYNKEFIISYEKRRTAGSFISLEISWTWPKMFDIGSGYVTLSTCYSEVTKKIKHTLIPHEEQKLDKISLWKYKVSMKEPLFLREISKENGVFYYEIENPDKMTDYILCYKTTD